MNSGKKTGLIILLAILAVILLFVFSMFSSYNRLVASEENVSKLESDIQADLQRRTDLIPNLVATVKAYAAHEEEIFTSIANARAAIIGAGNMQEAAEADAAMNTALSRLLAIAENYPDLKANENFRDLQTQLEGTENRIKVARTKYNQAVSDYNTLIRRFPSVIIAGLFGFDKAEYFEARAGAENPPLVNFGD